MLHPLEQNPFASIAVPTGRCKVLLHVFHVKHRAFKILHLQHILYNKWDGVCHHDSGFIFVGMFWCVLNLSAGVR